LPRSFAALTDRLREFRDAPLNLLAFVYCFLVNEHWYISLNYVTHP
jgi:hypothetical protein